MRQLVGVRVPCPTAAMSHRREVIASSLRCSAGGVGRAGCGRGWRTGSRGRWGDGAGAGSVRGDPGPGAAGLRGQPQPGWPTPASAAPESPSRVMRAAQSRSHASRKSGSCRHCRVIAQKVSHVPRGRARCPHSRNALAWPSSAPTASFKLCTDRSVPTATGLRPCTVRRMSCRAPNRLEALVRTKLKRPGTGSAPSTA